MQQPTTTRNANLPDDEAFSIKAEVQKLWQSVVYAFRYWRLLTVVIIIGALAGICFAWWKPVSYTSRITFVVEEAKGAGGGGSLMSALAGQFGIDVGSLSGTSGVLAGDNVLELLKSHSLIKKTLLTPFDSANRSLADEYANVYGLTKKWEHSSKVGRVIHFPVGQRQLGRTEDSLMQRIVKRILEDELAIAKPDKKLGFFELSTSMRGERLSLLFSQRLLKTATDFYIETKTRRLAINVKRLQDKADSLLSTLNKKTYSAADANRLLLDINPAYANPEVSAEISSRDKLIQGTIYADIVKNLEISKTSLIQETPTVQVVDDPEVPLRNNSILYWVAAITGAALFFFVTVVLVIIIKKDN